MQYTSSNSSLIQGGLSPVLLAREYVERSRSIALSADLSLMVSDCTARRGIISSGSLLLVSFRFCRGSNAWLSGEDLAILVPFKGWHSSTTRKQDAMSSSEISIELKLYRFCNTAEI